VVFSCEKVHFQHRSYGESERVTIYEKRELLQKVIEEEHMNQADGLWTTLSLLIALSAVMVNLSEWQLAFFAIIMIVCFLRRDQRRGQWHRRNKSRQE